MLIPILQSSRGEPNVIILVHDMATNKYIQHVCILKNPQFGLEPMAKPISQAHTSLQCCIVKPDWGAWGQCYTPS